MKRNFIFSFLAIITISMQAQTWNFIKMNERYHYQYVDDTIPMHTIFIDSSFSTGEISTQFLNRFFLPCDTCSEEGYYLGNQPGFLQRNILFLQASSTLTLQDPEQYVINLPGSGHMEWWFDANNTQKASLDTIVEKDVFGKQDSVAIISINASPQIEISKTYGLLRYFDFTLTGLEYAELGKWLPGFKEIYNYEVDDVFMYETSWSGPEDGDSGSLKKKVLSVTDAEDYYDFEFYKSYWSVYYPFVSCTNKYELSRLENESHHYANTYPNQLIPIYGYCFNNCLDSMYWNEKPIAWSFSTLAVINNRLTKVVGYKGNYSSAANIALPFNLKNGDLYWFDEKDFDTPMEFEFQYAVSLGNIVTNYMEFEHTERQNLIGYIKNGETFGTVREGSCTNSIMQNEDDAFKVYPNPSNGRLSIELENTDFATLSIYSTEGMLVDSFKAISGQVYDFNHLAEGVYIIELSIENKYKQVKWVKE